MKKFVRTWVKNWAAMKKKSKNLEDKVQLYEKENSELNGKLEEHRKQYGDDSDLIEKLAINRKTFEEANAVSGPLTSSKETEEDGARKKASNIRKGSENRNRIAGEIKGCITLIDHMIKESDYSKYAEAKEKLELVLDELEDEVIKTKAIVLLQQSLGESKRRSNGINISCASDNYQSSSRKSLRKWSKNNPEQRWFSRIIGSSRSL